MTHNNAGYGKQIIDSGKYAPKTGPLDELHDRCLHWFGEHYDLDAINVMLAAAAVERLDGDPLWLLIVSGPGATPKPKPSSRLRGLRALVVSTISSDGALLSGDPAEGNAQGRDRRVAAPARRPWRARSSKTSRQHPVPAPAHALTVHGGAA